MEKTLTNTKLFCNKCNDELSDILIYLYKSGKILYFNADIVNLRCIFKP